ncbi:MAG: replication-relaxation family protein, partial [Pseudomonadota bacterium]
MPNHGTPRLTMATHHQAIHPTHHQKTRVMIHWHLRRCSRPRYCGAMQYARKHVANRRAPLPRLTPRAVKWLERINRHGPLPSSYLYGITRDTHRCKDTALRQMQTLCQQGILFRPPQQQSALYAPFNPYIYDLTDRGYDALFEKGIDPNPARPTGHFPHLFLTACVTASIEMNAIKSGVECIEASTILNLRNVDLSIPLRSGKLIPDQLFATKNNDGYRVFALEVDRGTEPAASTKTRKSYFSSIQAYSEVLTCDLHRRHY